MATGRVAEQAVTGRVPRRRARGECRMAQILEAAAEVFHTVGYEGATTNAIAARAGISPGSLYQFFGNKDEIVRALIETYVVGLGAAHVAALDGEDLAALSLDDLVGRVLDPLVRYNREHRAFKALFARTDMPRALSEATGPLHEAMLQRVVALLTARAPQSSPADLRHAAIVAIQLVKALMPMIAVDDMTESERYRRELHLLLVDYLSRVEGS
ncbi:TetR/AcrR family transcriptional regulator [Pseudonocardia aurantiaca]|uniref:TetR/AcrR family transcriptional regulator n=1 Tax=Pseudonocardia aurantiaca TaxID=75290 RepID=A0ABW4FQE6_9PSEU